MRKWNASHVMGKDGSRMLKLLLDAVEVLIGNVGLGDVQAQFQSINKFKSAVMIVKEQDLICQKGFNHDPKRSIKRIRQFPNGT